MICSTRHTPPDADDSSMTHNAGLRAAPGWPDAPRPVTTDDLLPERALSGDGHARRQLVHEVYQPLHDAGPPMLDTVASFLDHGGSIEATARAMFVHPNTVRYRLKRAADVTGLSVSDPRQAYTYQMALTLGRLWSRETGATGVAPEPGPVEAL